MTKTIANVTHVSASVPPQEEARSVRGIAALGQFLCRASPTGRMQRFMQTKFRKWCPDYDYRVPTMRGFQMEASPYDYSTYRIFFFREYEASMSNIISSHLFEGQTALDIGANRGWFSLLMGTIVGPTGRVDSFEPYPPMFDRLQRNLQINNLTWVRPQCVALGSTVGDSWFVPPSDAVIHHVEHLTGCTGVGYLTDKQSEGAIRVPSMTLDQYASETALDDVNMMKIDVEGAETAVIHGGRHTIEKSRPILAVEYNVETAQRAGTSVEELDQLLSDLRYDRFVYSGYFRKLNLQEYLGTCVGDGVFNVYCFPR